VTSRKAGSAKNNTGRYRTQVLCLYVDEFADIF